MISTVEEAAVDRPTGPPRNDASTLRDAAAAILERHPCVGMALGVVRGGEPPILHVAGVADIASRAPITEDNLFRIASITKTFTAIAILQLCEQGLVDLDAPANDYLRAFRLVPAQAAWRPATLRHLLTHTAGLPEVVQPWHAVQPDFGESVPVDRPLPSLADFYRGALHLVAEPGTRFRYGNHSPATLGQVVEDVSGMPLAQYFRERIFEPLGMMDTDLRRTDEVRVRLATGYELGKIGPKAVTPREMVTAGAASVYSSPRDMARYLAALLGGGTNEHGTVLRPATVASMFAPQYQPDPRIPGLGLAFFRIDLAGHPAVEHQGTMPGFHSQVFLAPEDGVAVMAFTNGAWQPDFWLPAECSGLLRQLVGPPQNAPSPANRPRPDLWRDLCGWYWLPGPATDIRLRAMLGAGVEVFVRDGQLTLRFLSPIPMLYRGFPLQPDDDADPYVFRANLGDMAMRIVFGQDESGRTTRVYPDIMPLTMYRKPEALNPRRWAAGALALGATTLAVTASQRAKRRDRAR